MKKLQTRFRAIDKEDIAGQFASKQDTVGAHILDEPTIVYDRSAGNAPVLLRTDLDTKGMLLLEVILSLATKHKFADNVRRIAQGDGYPCEVFGAVPSNEIFRKYGASLAEFEARDPVFASALRGIIAMGWRQTRREAPDLAAAMSSYEWAHKDWLIEHTPYTSGVINDNVQMSYHRDRRNVKWSGSTMVVCRRHVTGGHLHLPELDLLVKCTHGTVLSFYGEMYWHGVTPMEGSTRDRAGRYSIVAYSKSRIQMAGSSRQEHRSAAIRATKAGDDIRDTVIKLPPHKRGNSK